MTRLWTGKGCSMPRSASALATGLDTPRSAKDVCGHRTGSLRQLRRAANGREGGDDGPRNAAQWRDYTLSFLTTGADRVLHGERA